MTNDTCKLCKRLELGLGGYEFLNKYSKTDICSSCGDAMKYMNMDLVKDKVVFKRKIRCDICNFRICEINSELHCLWCLDDDKILRHRVLYGKYVSRTHAYVLQNDFHYCLQQIKYRDTKGFNDSKLTHLTKKVLSKIALYEHDLRNKNKYSRWM